jgi:hypothetical protein
MNNGEIAAWVASRLSCGFDYRIRLQGRFSAWHDFDGTRCCFAVGNDGGDWIRVCGLAFGAVVADAGRMVWLAGSFLT